MTGPLRVLLVEDSDTDAKLVAHALRATGRELCIERVEDADAMRAALSGQTFDIVISDWSLPRFSGRAALDVVKASQLDLPFILVSGTVGEEPAVEAMRAGAHDYVLKDKLARLAPAVERELRERDVRAARRLADEAIRLQEARFRALIEKSDEGIALADRDAKILYVSPGARRIFGIGDRDMTGMPFATSVYADDLAHVLASGARVRAVDAMSETMEFRIVRPDGMIRWLEATVVNRLEDPAVAAVVANFHDVTDRKVALDQLYESELRFRRIWEAGLFGIAVTDGAGGYVDANDALLEMVGYTREDLRTGKIRWADMTPREWDHTTIAASAQLSRLGRAKPWEKEYIRKDGTRVPILVGVASLTGTRNISIVVDLTELKRAEQARRESETRFRRLWESGLVGIAITDMQGDIVDANDALLALFGYTREDLAAGGIRWLDMTPPDTMAATDTAVAELVESGTARPWEQEYIRKDRTRVSVLVAAATLPPAHNISLLLDLSRQKKAERALEETEAQLRQAQKMEAIGRLAGGIAHDFNNLLSVILSYGELIAGDLKAGDPMRDDIGEICKAGTRAAELTSQLLMFSRQQVLEPTIVDLNDVLAKMDKMLRRVLGEDVDLASVPTVPLGFVKVDRSSLEQVVMNLVVNARDAMPTGGQLTIETGEVVLDEEFARAHVGVVPGPHVMLAVTDTGTGMDRETQAKIFEPFFTTKGLGKGTGLGLSTVFGIIQQSNGTVWVYSEPGHGTTFKVYLPRVAGEITAERAALPALNLRGVETVLLVEDEDAVRTVACGILRRFGYTVIEARNGGEALLHTERHAGKIDLLLTDVVMPQMSGPALAKRLLLIRPELKVLCMSGYTDDSVVRHGVIEAEIAYLQKPLTPDSLTRKVREVLDGR